MRVLVTGASGFVGANVVQALLGDGHLAITASRGERGPRLSAYADHPRFRHLTLDLEADLDLDPLLSEVRPDAVVHCAAYGANPSQRDAQRMVRVNILGTLRLHDAATRCDVARFVHIGTGFEYGPQAQAVNESVPLRPLGMYAATKAAATMVLSQSAATGGPRPVFLRLFNTFGTGDSPSRLPQQIVDGSAAHRQIALTAGGQRRDFLWVGDAARAISTVATLDERHYPAGEVFNLASGSPTSVRAFAERLARALGAEHLLAFGAIEERADAPTDLFPDGVKWRAFCEKIGRPDLCRATPLERVALDLLPSA